MEAELKNRVRPQSQPPLRKTRRVEQDWKPTIDICGISGNAFHLNLRDKDNTFFTTSLYEIDRILQEKHEEANPEILVLEPGDRQPEETELQWLKRILPDEYRDYADVFSKEASDILPPSRSYDHKIQIDDSQDVKDLGFSPLYQQSTAELEELKRYLTENLDKGFIDTSQAPFASPVLFVKKPNGSLRFCIDFRKLNRLT